MELGERVFILLNSRPDHIVLAVHELDRCKASFERITRVAPGEFSFGDHNRRFLQQGEGMSMLVFSSADARADQQRWQACALQTYPLFDFSRNAKLFLHFEICMIILRTLDIHAQVYINCAPCPTRTHYHCA